MVGEHHVRQDSLTSQGETGALSKVSSKPFMSRDAPAAHPGLSDGCRNVGALAGCSLLFTSNYHTQPRGSRSGGGGSSRRGCHLTFATWRRRRVSAGASFPTGPVPRMFMRQAANNHYRLHVITMHGSAIIYLASHQRLARATSATTRRSACETRSSAVVGRKFDLLRPGWPLIHHRVKKILARRDKESQKFYILNK